MYVVNANPQQMMITIKVIKTSPLRPGWLVAGWLGGQCTGDGVPRYNYEHIDCEH